MKRVLNEVCGIVEREEHEVLIILQARIKSVFYRIQDALETSSLLSLDKIKGRFCVISWTIYTSGKDALKHVPDVFKNNRFYK